MDHRDCIFCKIVRGEAPCHRVFEDDHVLAFMDIQPVGDGHLLIVPKAHSRACSRPTTPRSAPWRSSRAGSRSR